MNKTVRPDPSNRGAHGVPTGQKATRTPGDAPCYASGDLFHGGDRIWIEHNSERYSLRITRQKKLILTK